VRRIVVRDPVKGLQGQPGISMKLPVFRAIGATYAYVFRHIVPLAIAGFVIFEIKDKVIWGLNYFMHFDLEKFIGNSAGKGPEFFEANLLPLYIVYMIALFLIVVFGTGFTRYALGAEKSVSFRFGRDEMIVLATLFLTWLSLFALFFAGGLVAGLAAGQSSPVPPETVASPSARTNPIGAMALVVMALIAFWFAIRASLASAVAIKRRRIGIVGSFRATKGNFWRLFGFWALIFITIELFAIVVGGLAGGLMAVADLWRSGVAREAEQVFTTPVLIEFQTLGAVIGIMIASVASGTAYRMLMTQSEVAEHEMQADNRVDFNQGFSVFLAVAVIAILLAIGVGLYRQSSLAPSAVAPVDGTTPPADGTIQAPSDRAMPTAPDMTVPAAVLAVSACNRTSTNIYVAAFYRQDASSSISEGWWVVPAAECLLIFRTAGSAFDLYAYQLDSSGAMVREWTGAKSHCVQFPGPYKTTVHGLEPCEIGSVQKQFMELHADVSLGQFSYDFTDVPGGPPSGGSGGQ
jgi:uncharacterized membrane protein